MGIEDVKLGMHSEQKAYHADEPADLDALAEELEPGGWSVEMRSRCPDDCTCGKGPFWIVMSREITDAVGPN